MVNHALIRHCVLCIMIGLLLTACTGRKKATESSGSDVLSVGVSMGLNPQAERIVSTLNSHRSNEQALSAKLDLSLASGDKQANVGGNLRMKRNDVIQLSIVVLGLMEAGRIELTPDYLLLVNRLEHQYVKVKYSDVPFLQKAGVDFHTFQSLFWNELFLLGDKGNAPREKDFRKKLVGDEVQLTNEESDYMLLTFLANTLNGLLQRSTIQGKSANAGNLSLDWQYQGFEKFGESDFPNQMQLNLNTGKKAIRIQMGLNNIKATSDWETRTQVTKKYTEIPLNTILNQLMKLVN